MFLAVDAQGAVTGLSTFGGVTAIFRTAFGFTGRRINVIGIPLGFKHWKIKNIGFMPI